MRICWVGLAIVGLAACLVGCGGGKGGAATTPEGTVKAMVAAIGAGDAQGLAVLYDYSDDAKAQNENWGEIPKGQQDLILKEEAKRGATALEPGMEKMKAYYKDAKVGKAQVSGETATVTVGSQTVSLVQRNGKWYLAGGAVQ